MNAVAHSDAHSDTKSRIVDLIFQALAVVAPGATVGNIVLERPKLAAHGD